MPPAADPAATPDPPTIGPGPYTVAQAALLLGLSESTVRRHIGTKQLASFRAPGTRHLRVLGAELLRYLREGPLPKQPDPAARQLSAPDREQPDAPGKGRPAARRAPVRRKRVRRHERSRNNSAARRQAWRWTRRL